MLKPTIKLNKELWAKVKKCSEAGGYSSPEEFVEHVLEKELAAFETPANRAWVRNTRMYWYEGIFGA